MRLTLPNKIRSHIGNVVQNVITSHVGKNSTREKKTSNKNCLLDKKNALSNIHK